MEEQLEQPQQSLASSFTAESMAIVEPLEVVMAAVHVAELEKIVSEGTEETIVPVVVDAGAAAAADVPPTCKEPHRLKKLYEQILQHPDFESKLPSIHRLTMQRGARSYTTGMAWSDPESNHFARLVWRHLYLNQPESLFTFCD